VDVEELFYPVVSATAAVALLFRLPGLVRSPHDPARRALAAMLASIAFGLALGTPSIYAWLDRLTGVPNLARILSHLGIVTLCLSGQLLLLHLALPPHAVRRRHRLQRIFLGIYVAVAVIMVALFVAAPVDVDTSDFYGLYGEHPLVGAYVGVYMTYLGAGFGNLAGLAWVYRTRTNRPLLRNGLLLIALGSPFAVAYAVEKVVYVGARQLGDEPWSRSVQEEVSPIIGSPGGIMLLVGILLPSVGPQVLTLVRYLRLRPLWRLMYRAAPDVKLRIFTWEPETLLLRRCAGIRDGMWKLRPYLSLATAQRAHRLAEQAGQTGDEVAATTTAAVLVDGARAKTRRQQPPALYTVDTKGGADLQAETAWLLQVTGKLTSPVVRRAVNPAFDPPATSQNMPTPRAVTTEGTKTG
jgi:hypothetical protein